LTARVAGTKNVEKPNALPLVEVGSEHEARVIVQTVGRLMYDGRYVWSWPLPSSKTKTHAEFVSASEAVGIQAIHEARHLLEEEGFV